MTTIMYDPLDAYEDEPIPQTANQSLRDAVLSIQESLREAHDLHRQLSASRNRVITFRIPVELLARLDAVTEDAATSRGHMLRQIVADYMSYVEDCDIRYNGSLLSIHSSKKYR
jgi:predicted DNA-binding protein